MLMKGHRISTDMHQTWKKYSWVRTATKFKLFQWWCYLFPLNFRDGYKLWVSLLKRIPWKNQSYICASVYVKIHPSDQQVTLNEKGRVRSKRLLYFLKSLALSRFLLYPVMFCTLPHSRTTIFPSLLDLVSCPPLKSSRLRNM